jgi:hypothetical protein
MRTGDVGDVCSTFVGLPDSTMRPPWLGGNIQKRQESANVYEIPLQKSAKVYVVVVVLVVCCKQVHSTHLNFLFKTRALKFQAIEKGPPA